MGIYQDRQKARTKGKGPYHPNLAPVSSGFTLLELLIVIAILAMTTALVLPRLPMHDEANLRSSARSLAATLRYLGERSVTSKTAYRLHLNIADQSVKVMKKLASGDEVPPEEALLSRRILAEGVTITDIQTSRLGTVREGEVLFDFGSRGLTEFINIHLQTASGRTYTVTGFPENGKVKVLAGYQESSL